jgi:hypothetical protein
LRSIPISSRCFAPLPSPTAEGQGRLSRRRAPIGAVHIFMPVQAFAVSRRVSTNRAPRRSGTKAGAAPRVGGFVFNFFRLNTANCKLKTALRAAVCASALGGARSAQTPPPQPARRSDGSSLDDAWRFCRGTPRWCRFF